MSLRRSAEVLVLASVLAAAPAQAWLAVLSGAADGNDVAEAVALLPGGDVVVTGSVQNGATHEDLLAARLDARSGRPVWRVELNGESAGDDPEFALDAGWDVAVDRRGDVFIGGTIQTPEGGPDATVLRLDGRTGRERWRAYIRIAGATTFDIVHDVLVHPSGDVIVVALTTDDFATHFFAVRLDGVTGEQRWRQPLPFASHQRHLAALDPTGNLVVAGLDYDYVADHPVAKVLEVAGDGRSVVWSGEFPGLGLGAFAVGPHGEVFLGGQEWDAGGSDGVAIRLDGATGAEAWRLVVPGPFASIGSLAVARDGELAVGGTLDDDGDRVVFVARHDPITGAPHWRTILDRAASLLPYPAGGVSPLIFDRHGDVLAASVPVDPLGSRAVVRLDARTGAERWRHDTGDTSTAALMTTPRGDVVSAGQTQWTEATGIDVAVFALDGRSGGDLGGRGSPPSSGGRPPQSERPGLLPWMRGI